MADTKPNMCAVLYGPYDLRIDSRAVPQPRDEEVQIAIHSVGICGSDISLYHTGAVSLYPLKHPLIMGHEPCGIISAVGSAVTEFSIGDRVAIEPNISCELCVQCTSGHNNLCHKAQAMATPNTNGALANYIVWPARLCYKLPSHLSWTEGAMMQPLSLAIYGCQRAGLREGHRVLVCGAGPLGMMMVLTAKAGGAIRVCVTEVNEARLQHLARVSGCAAVLVGTESTQDTAYRVLQELGGPPDVSIECSGSPAAVSVAIHATKPAGCILMAGLGPKVVEIPLLTAVCKEVEIKSMFRFVNTFSTAIDMMSSGLVDVKPLVTHRFSLKDVVQAFELAGRGEGGKIIIECSN